MNLNELIFFSSALVPSSVESFFLIETFTSHRIDPSAIFPSHMSKKVTSCLIALKYATASFAFDISGSDTISSRGVPALFKSTPVSPSKRS